MSLLWDGLSIFIEPLECAIRRDVGAVILIDRAACPANDRVSGKDIENLLAVRRRCPVWGKFATWHIIRFRVPRKRERWARYLLRTELGLEV